jgi:hypothetical protein
MRLKLVCLLLLVPAACWAGDPRVTGTPAPPPSASILLRVHPGPWQPPARADLARLGMTLVPETGEPSVNANLDAGALTAAQARARAQGTLRTFADGSRHVLTGGAIRSWTLARIDEDGRLVQDCVHSEAEAVRRVNAAAAAAGRK